MIHARGLLKILYSYFYLFTDMNKVEQWVIQNNPDYFVRELTKQSKSELDWERSIENIKQAELELLAILQSEQVRKDEETV